MVPSPMPFKLVIHVVVESVDEAGAPTDTFQMSCANVLSDFAHKGLKFTWRGKQLSVLRIGSGLCVHVFHGYDEQFTAHGEHNHRLLVTTKATQADADAYVASLGPPSA